MLFTLKRHKSLSLNSLLSKITFWFLYETNLQQSHSAVVLHFSPSPRISEVHCIFHTLKSRHILPKRLQKSNIVLVHINKVNLLLFKPFVFARFRRRKGEKKKPRLASFFTLAKYNAKFSAPTFLSKVEVKDYEKVVIHVVTV